jgi:ethanolamine utilization protein EutA
MRYLFVKKTNNIVCRGLSAKVSKDLYPFLEGADEMEEKWITSVGIDIGTSTTKWIMSKLKLMKTSGGFSLPRYEISERRLDYVSPIYTTPLINESEIDMAALSQLLDQEYKHAGLTAGMVQTGAVIITGETATKKNAEQIVHALAKMAGQFVVATAGADLESILAGKGSGAEAYSHTQPGVIVNIDVGGGTANAAYIRDGEMIATITLHVGGRLIRIDKNGQVAYIAPPLKLWAERGAGLNVPIEGTAYSFFSLQELCRQMAKALIDCILGLEPALEGSSTEALLVASTALPLPIPDEIWISGGVGGLMEMPVPKNIEEAAKFGDIGPLLAAALREHAASCAVPLRQAKESERATVIGAGTQTTEISGATLFYDDGVLPLRNVPAAVCYLPKADQNDENDSLQLDKAIGAAMFKASKIYGASLSDPPFALALRDEGYCTYKRLQRLAERIVARYKESAQFAGLLLVICENDMAKALGHALTIRLPANMKLVCIDQIRPSDGDYIDVGEPLKDDIVPVVIKTLVFNKKAEVSGHES